MFLTSLEVREIGWKGGRVIWELTSPLIYKSAKHGLIAIPTKMQTDFCSVPRHPSFVFGLCGAKFNRTGTLHDYACRINSVPVFTQEEADALFLESSGYCWPGETEWLEREAMYEALVLFGKEHFHKLYVEDKLT